MTKQLRLFDVPPRFNRYTLTPTEVRLGKHWLPICRQALATAVTEVQPAAVPSVLHST